MKNLAQLGNELYSGKTSIPFIARRKVWYSTALGVIAVALVLLATVGLNPGIDFKGGTEVTVTGIESPSEAPASAVVAQQGLPASTSVTTMGTSSVRVQTTELSSAQSDALSTALAEAYDVEAANVSATTIGPTWSSDVTSKALRGLILFFLLVGALIWAYFRTWKMAVAALLALCHDILVTVGVYAATGFEVTPATIIGVLTILGYSLYDTVVVFDKIRENTDSWQAQTRSTYAELANLAVNQTFVRSVNTSVVGVLPVASLLVVGAFILGAGTLRDIALTLFIGMIAGTLSSVFLATPLLVDLRRREKAVVEHTQKVTEARARRLAEAGDDPEALAALTSAPTASPLIPGHHLGAAAQPKRKKKRS
ncbi:MULTISPECIES: protein translocase subunit SecF [unclassified Actinomyces]|uniref:protein translocase subunit SecF n=1 Tax=unclassified Actinomyces TaxID=2609248 RepID=UPI0020179489|nr:MULTISPECIES: protein translocase subunit SecF [unclassified Actinomyces]MCL3778344.1 protein translocase subunit SecF [Actinomyces sp. AC-20-1]MCL3790209.1 protein translocase subunit SecF [Actinomyces sp. 187325]MCL3792480.1 protein translocase subunit SecF [Actinomyces sp. 186855]MCL3794316.1 protein translocase subunit SecF [Actinomyces sp. 217892]